MVPWVEFIIPHIFLLRRTYEVWLVSFVCWWQLTTSLSSHKVLKKFLTCAKKVILRLRWIRNMEHMKHQIREQKGVCAMTSHWNKDKTARKTNKVSNIRTAPSHVVIVTSSSVHWVNIPLWQIVPAPLDHSETPHWHRVVKQARISVFQNVIWKERTKLRYILLVSRPHAAENHQLRGTVFEIVTVIKESVQNICNTLARHRCYSFQFKNDHSLSALLNKPPLMLNVQLI